MGKLKTKFQDFDRETGKATFIYSYKSQTFEGSAQCHEEDMDMCSELVGLKYAEIRAFKQYLKVRKQELVTRLETLQGTLRHLSTSGDFNPHSRYAKKLRDSILETKEELQDCRDGLRGLPAYLKKDMDARDILYKKVREKRKEE